MRAWLVAGVLSATAGSMTPAYAQAPLSVPYVPQAEALCGGAAAAMVMRFWGARGVYADDFAPLVDRKAAGIHTSVLRAALEAQGWLAQAGSGDLARLSAEIGLGHPVIALIEDRPARFHYVVVVAAAPGGPIVVHDPARAPSRSIAAEMFDDKWQRSDRWMLVLTPGPATLARRAAGESTATATPSRVTGSACAPTVDEAIALAQRGDRAGARKLLEQATTACPADAGGWRELAGIDALDQRWSEAAAHARRALDRDRGDDLALRVLATAEYVQHHDLDALAAWNRLDEPRVDLVAIDGLSATRYRVVADAVGVQPRDVLTPDGVRIAQRRVRAIPAVSSARIAFQPLEGGLARVDATIVERERAPATYPSWIGMAAGAAANREVSAAFTNVSGGGDALDVSWRWWTHRPRIAASYSAPGPWGIWRFEASRETQTFGLRRFEETRSRLGGEISNWIDQRVRIGGGLAVDRWNGLGQTAVLSTRGEVWPVLDRLSLEMSASAWRGSGASFGTAAVRTRARSKASSSGTLVLADGGYALASTSAPSSLWPGADAGHAREVLLRAHPLLDDGVIEGGVFGRRVAFGSIEGERWLRPSARGLLRVAPAVFLDVARASRGLATTDTRTHYDAGAGLRISLPGAGVLRVDAARGLRDGAMALSVGWQR